MTTDKLLGCACRWDAEGDRVVTCERHEGWLEVIAEWADRAREAEAKLKAASPAAPTQEFEAWWESAIKTLDVSDDHDAYIGARAAWNAATPPASDPAGRISRNCEGILRQEVMLYADKHLPIGTAVYTKPVPQRQWVGLTNDRREEISRWADKHGNGPWHLTYAEAIEAELRKNNAVTPMKEGI